MARTKGVTLTPEQSSILLAWERLPIEQQEVMVPILLEKTHSWTVWSVDRNGIIQWLNHVYDKVGSMLFSNQRKINITS